MTTARTVDEADRVTLVDLPGTALDTTYGYGSTPANFDVGRLIGVTRNASTIVYGYDRFGRTLSDGALSYTYDGNGNPLTITYPGNLQAIYTYDKMDRPISLQSKEGAAAAVYVVKNSPASTYRAYGPLATLVFNTTTNRTETRAYDFRNQPTSITVSGSLFTLSYTTDKVGNITQQQRTLPAPTETRGYGYQDWQYYLTCGSGPWGGTACSPSPTGNPLQWTYDKIGNRATEVRAGLTDSYVYDDNSGATGDTAVLDVVNLGVLGTRDYTFDNGGFLTQIAAGANVLGFTFDDAGELGSVVRGAQSLTNSYDGRGFLQSAADATSGGYVNATYSSSGLLHSLERLPASGGTLERHNVLYFAGRPIAIWKKVGVAAASTTYLVTDHLGTPAYALNQAGTEYWKGGLEPFGRDWQEGTANDMLTKGIFLRFPGQWDDGLFTNATLGGDSYYNLSRWYESQVGRYSRADSISIRGGVHLFLYANANPILNLDQDGRAYCTYSVTNRRLRCRSAKLPPSATKEINGPILSGLESCANNPQCFDDKDKGPVPPGIYQMNHDDRTGHEKFWRLERTDDPVSGWDYYVGGERGGFMLHPGTVSLGCITVDSRNPDAMLLYDEIHKLLQSEDGDNWMTVTQ